jgi:uncharacterized protein (DUF952 family)
MMIYFLHLLTLTAALLSTSGIVPNEISATQGEMMTTEKSEAPTILYKVISEKQWADSQQNNVVTLSEMDDAFIHLANEDQLEKIIDKFWGHIPKFVVLKLQTNKLEGEMVYEANPGGTTKYYHLYQGVIPVSSVIEVKVIDRTAH